MIGRAISTALLAATLTLAGCGRTSPPKGTRTAPLRLVVLVVIDQWPSWGFEQRRDLYRHGLARLIDGGTLYPRAEYPYAITFTAPGHATLATGAPPSVNGIVANGWWRREEGRERPAEYDRTVAILPLPGRSSVGLEGASGHPLLVDGVADELRRATGGAARSVAIGGKPRAACLVAGRRPDVALWYEPAVTGMTTSTAYGDALPGWVLALDRRHPVAPLLDETWAAPDPALLARRTGIPDDAGGEGSEHEMGIRFPYRLAASAAPAKALRATPLLDRIEIDAALAAVAGERLGADDTPDLLAISLSAHDYIGHNWGQESWELLAHELALDVELGRLLAGLDRAVGARRYAVVLTSDHGATPLVERGAHPGARRIPPAELEAAAEEAAATVLGGGDWVSTISSGMVYLSPAALARPPDDVTRTRAAVTARLSTVPQVARVIDLDALPVDCASLDDADATRACLSRVPGQSGNLLVIPTDGSLITTYTTGTSHDSISADNRFVPLVVYRPGVAAATRTEIPSILSVAPTLASLLRIPPPPAATAPSLLAPR